jgi:NADPH:quinone reductase-like Zn-dependent oxidoreductase
VTNLVERLGYDPRPDLEELAGLVAGGELTVHVDRVLALEDAADAHRRLEDRAHPGKILLTPGTG